MFAAPYFFIRTIRRLFARHLQSSCGCQSKPFPITEISKRLYIS